jgi:hypothetical protein
MRPPALVVSFLLAGAPTLVMATEPAGSLWVGTSGLQARLTDDGQGNVVLRAEHGGLFGDLFSGISSGTVLLRGRRVGDELVGENYVFSRDGCVFSYHVRGRWLDKDTRIIWSGDQPKDKSRSSCNVTRTEHVTTVLSLKWAPSPPTPPRPVVPVAKQQSAPRPAPASPHQSFEFSLPVPTIAIVAVGVLVAAPVAVFALRLVYLKAMAILADAQLSLAEKRSQMAAVFPVAEGATLSASEIADLLEAGFPEIDVDLREAITRTIAAAIKDKAA